MRGAWCAAGGSAARGAPRVVRRAWCAPESSDRAPRLKARAAAVAAGLGVAAAGADRYLAAMPRLPPNPTPASEIPLVQGRSAAWRAALQAGLLCGALWFASCSQQTVQTQDRFWLRAPGPALLRLTPPPAPGAPGVVQRTVVEGTVEAHGPSARAGVDFQLRVAARGGGHAELLYRIGLRRRLPLAVDDRVRIELLVRPHAGDDGQDQGLLVYRKVAELQAVGDGAAAQQPDEGPNKRPGTGMATVARRHLLAVVDQSHIVEDRALPESLRALRPTDVVAYEASGRFRGDCQDVQEHRYFRLLQPRLLIGSDAKVLAGRFFAPGSRLRLRGSDDERFDMVLLSNRAVSRSTCRFKPDPTYSWAAVRVEAEPAP